MKGLLKFITCGSVDDGKSTLIGHLLYDAKLLYADQKKALELDSRIGSREGEIDYSLLLDGLMAEREQGITIDAAYRYFTTDNRSFIVADTPGHEEYTRNMAVGASFADLAVILVDARQGVLLQTRRHARICSLVGIQYFVFAINKMDLVDYDESVFRQIEQQVKALAKELDLKNVTLIPVSATEGDNVTLASENIPWYQGPALLPFLEQTDVTEIQEEGFYMPVQRVSRPNHEFRGFQGEIESGQIAVGDEIVTLPSQEKARVKSIHYTDKSVDKARKGQPVTIQLDREMDVSRGCVLSVESGAEVTDLLDVTLLWMDDEPLTKGKNFFLKLGTKLITGMVTKIIHRIDVNTGEECPTKVLHKNEIALCRISLSDAIVADTFSRHKTLGEVILMDRISNMTSACGVVRKIYRQEEGWKNREVDSQVRAALKGQTPLTAVFPLSSDGITVEWVQSVEKQLIALSRHTYLYHPLDGDDIEGVVRHLEKAGLIVLLALEAHQKLPDQLQDTVLWVLPEQGRLLPEEVTRQIQKQTVFTADSLYGDYSI